MASKKKSAKKAPAKKPGAKRPAGQQVAARKPARRAGGGAKAPGPATVVPAMRYRDAPAAIEFLCKAFGFAKHLVVPGEGNVIHHAQLTLGNGMIMLGSVQDNDFGQHMAMPDEIGSRETQCAYVIVPDADAHHARAKAAGAVILRDIKTEDYGGRGYSCRDPEGHIWSFGTYDPWQPAEA
jgi:uncharacterized glyoxalase superfamily protein PhnB